DLAKPDSPIVELLMDFDAEYDFIDNDGPTFWFKTDLNAPRGRIIATDITKPQRDNWKELIPQSNDTLGRVDTIGGRFFAKYLHDAHSAVKIFALDGKPQGEV